MSQNPYFLSDAIIRPAHASNMSPHESAHALRRGGNQLDQLLHTNWADNPDVTETVIRAAGTYACLPTILELAKLQERSSETPLQVVDSLRTFSGLVLKSGLSDFTGNWKTRPDSEQIEGAINELSILATMSWGIANRAQKDGRYVLPSYGAQNHGFGTREGRYSLSTDLFLKRDGATRKERIQVVKRIGGTKSRESIKNLRPDIAVIGPFHLIDAPQDASLLLLDAFVSNDQTVMTEANRRAEELLEIARIKGDNHFIRMERRKKK